MTTYQMVKRWEGLREVGWRVVALDEAQAVKNPAAAQTRAVKRLRGRTRVALSGTPVENRLGDLWSLFDFLNPGLLGTAGEFAEAVKEMGGRADGAGDYAPLRRLVAPYLLRRLKTDPAVAPDLPEKVETRAECALSREQARLYQAGVRELARELKEKEGIERKGLVLAYLTRFKQICDHPALWTGTGDFTAGGSGKFARLAELCGEIAERREKALVFTQFREMCGPLARHLEGVFGRPGLVLHGGTPVKSRQRLVQSFQDAQGPPFFVLSLKAGGTGLNLTAASHVIHFDRWWNPAVENQATDRAFRIGQRRNVLVHKFLCPGTIEERIDRLIASKTELAGQVTGGEGAALPALTEMSDDDLLGLVALT